MTLQPGSRVPLHCTASGKLLLALLPTRAAPTHRRGARAARAIPTTRSSIARARGRARGDPARRASRPTTRSTSRASSAWRCRWRRTHARRRLRRRARADGADDARACAHAGAGVAAHGECARCHRRRRRRHAARSAPAAPRTAPNKPCGVQPARLNLADRTRGRQASARLSRFAASARIMSLAFSAIITTGALVLPDTSVGMIEQSTTRKPVHAVHAQPVVDDRHRVVRAHPAGARRMEDRRAVVARELEQLVVVCTSRPRADAPRRRRARSAAVAASRARDTARPRSRSARSRSVER